MNVCNVENCDNKLYAKGYCTKHYQLFSDHGIPEKKNNIQRLCILEYCDKPHLAKGFCKKHYTNWQKGKLPTYENHWDDVQKRTILRLSYALRKILDIKDANLK